MIKIYPLLMFLAWSCSSIQFQRPPEKGQLNLNGEGRSRLEIDGHHYVCRFESAEKAQTGEWNLSLHIPFSGTVDWSFDPRHPQKAIQQIHETFISQGLNQHLSAKLLVGDLIEFLKWRRNQPTNLKETWEPKLGQWILSSPDNRFPLTKVILHKYNGKKFERVTIEAWSQEPGKLKVPELRLEIFYTN